MARILTAGVNSALLDVLANELTGAGHEVIETMSGQDAYETTLSESPDMVFLEVPLPVFDGYETCRMIRNDPDIPATLPVVFLVTDDVDEKRLEKVGATGMISVVHQAYEVTDLLAAYLSPETLPGPD